MKINYVLILVLILLLFLANIDGYTNIYKCCTGLHADNNNSLHDYGNSQEWSYGFNLNVYLSDLHSDEAFITTEDEGQTEDEGDLGKP